MNDTGMKIGFWASLLQSIVGYLYVIVYIIFVITSPWLLNPWTGIADFALLYNGANAVLIIIIQVLAFLQAFFFFIIMVVISEKVTGERKTLVKIGVYCTVIFLALSSVHYYIQWTSVTSGILNGELEGLNLLAQFNMDSPVSMINMLGWMFFFGIANIILAFCFETGAKRNWLKWGFLINGIICVISFIFYTIGLKSISFLWMISLIITWYTYPMLTVLFRKEKLELR